MYGIRYTNMVVRLCPVRWQNLASWKWGRVSFLTVFSFASVLFVFFLYPATNFQKICRKWNVTSITSSSHAVKIGPLIQKYSEGRDLSGTYILLIRIRWGVENYINSPQNCRRIKFLWHKSGFVLDTCPDKKVEQYKKMNTNLPASFPTPWHSTTWLLLASLQQQPSDFWLSTAYSLSPALAHSCLLAHSIAKSWAVQVSLLLSKHAFFAVSATAAKNYLSLLLIKKLLALRLTKEVMYLIFFKSCKVRKEFPLPTVVAWQEMENVTASGSANKS